MGSFRSSFSPEKSLEKTFSGIEANRERSLARIREAAARGLTAKDLDFTRRRFSSVPLSFTV